MVQCRWAGGNLIETRELSQKFGRRFWLAQKRKCPAMIPALPASLGRHPSRLLQQRKHLVYSHVVIASWSRLHYFTLEQRRLFIYSSTIHSTRRKRCLDASQPQNGRHHQLHHRPPPRHPRTRIPIPRCQELPRPLQHVQSLPATVDSIRPSVLELSRSNDLPRTEPASRTT